MTPRDLAFWLQGYFELTTANTPAQAVPSLLPAWTACVRNHAELVLKAHPDSGFALSVKALATEPAALRLVLQEQFVHVIDPTFNVKPEVDPAHPPRPPWDPGHVYRC